jgi:hypothetical protein
VSNLLYMGRVTLIRQITFFVCLAVTVTAEVVRLPSAELRHKVSLHGIVLLPASKDRIAFLRIGEGDPGSWLRVGSVLGTFRVAEIQRDMVVLSNSSGEREEIMLSGSTIGDSRLETSPAQVIPPSAYSPEWINSRANPMVFRALPIPREISERWGQLSAKDRAEVASWYQKHGWNLEVEAGEGYFSARFSNQYTEERKVIVAAKLEKFRASLTDTQREEYENLRQASVVVNSRGSDVDAVELAQRWQRFRNGLKPAQGSAILTISDFTRRD